MVGPGLISDAEDKYLGRIMMATIFLNMLFLNIKILAHVNERFTRTANSLRS